MTVAADLSTRTADDVPIEPRVDPTPAEAMLDDPTLDVVGLLPSPTRRLILPGRRESRGDRLAWTLIAVAVAALYLALLLSYWAPAHPGVDQNGYLVGGRQFSHTLSTGMKPDSPFGFVGRMWVRTTADDSGVYYPKYPLGLPIYYAANLWLAPKVGLNGPETAELLSPMAAALATLGIFAIVRQLSGSFMGVLAMLLAGLGQTFLTLSVNPNSHAAGTCAVVWGVAFLLGFLERGTVWRGILAGACLGVAYTIRYTDGLMLLPLGAALLFATRWAIPPWRRAAITVGATVAFALVAWIVGRFSGEWLVGKMPWLTPFTGNAGKPYKEGAALAIAGALVSLFVPWRSLWRCLAVVGAWCVPAGYLTLFNMVAMRSFTSYAGTNESTGFGWDYFFGNWEKMIRVLHDQGLFFIAPIGLLGLLLMFRRLPIVAMVLALWFVPSVLLYTAYYWAPDNQGVSYSRFVLTSIPALVVSAAWVMGEAANLRRTANRRGWLRPGAASMAFGAIALLGGLGLAVWGVRVGGDPRRDQLWWLIVPVGAIVTVVGAGRLLASVKWASRFRAGFEWHASGLLPRVSVAAVAFVACGLGGYRSVEGVEYGQRSNPRASVEAASRDNNNLAGLGRALRDAVSRDAAGKPMKTPIADDRVIVFGERERMHHLQFVGGWSAFTLEAFTPEAGRIYSVKPAFLVDDPDPIDPNTCEYMRGIYARYDEKSLAAEQNKLMSDALAQGKRIFYVLNKPSAATFEKRFITGRPFVTRLAETFVDVPAPRREEDYLTPDELPKQPVGGGARWGRGLPNVRQPIERSTWKVVEITLAPPPVVPPGPTPEQQMAARRDAEQKAEAAKAAKLAEQAKAMEQAKADKAKAAELARAERLKAAELARAERVAAKATSQPTTRPSAVATTKPAAAKLPTSAASTQP